MLYAGLFLAFGAHLPFWPAFLAGRGFDTEAIGWLLSASYLARVVLLAVIHACVDGLEVGPLLVGLLDGACEGSARLRSPRGLALHPLRGVLAVADSGHHRVVLVDTATLQLLAVWGQPDAWSAPTPGSEPGRFDTPTSLAFGRGGELYVLTNENFPESEGIHVVRMHEAPGILSPIVSTVPLQLLAYHAALARGNDVDKPRNLAKSVTVE